MSDAPVEGRQLDLPGELRTLGVLAHAIGLGDVGDELEGASRRTGEIVSMRTLGLVPSGVMAWLMGDLGYESMLELRAGAEAVLHTAHPRSSPGRVAQAILDSIDRISLATMNVRAVPRKGAAA